MMEADGEEDREPEVEGVGPEERREAAEGEAKAVDENASFGHVFELVVGCSLSVVSCGFWGGFGWVAACYQGCSKGERDEEFVAVESRYGIAWDGKANPRG